MTISVRLLSLSSSVNFRIRLCETDQKGLSSGQEFTIAISEARACGAKLLLGDRDVQVREFVRSVPEVAAGVDGIGGWFGRPRLDVNAGLFEGRQHSRYCARGVFLFVPNAG